MTSFRKRISALVGAANYFRHAVADLPTYQASSEQDRQRRKNIDQCLYEMGRERELLDREVLPPTFDHVDRKRWDYDVKAQIPKVEEKCRQVLKYAQEAQAELNPPAEKPGESWTHPGMSDCGSERWKKYQHVCSEISRLSWEIAELEQVLLARCDLFHPIWNKTASLRSNLLLHFQW
jgi:hypothetical protein